MIHTNRTVTVGNQESIIDSPIILYRGDRQVEVEFTLNGNKFTFTNGGNVIKSTNATHGQLVINTPTGENMFSDITECHEGKVVFLITKEMIDELVEIGFYSFQIRLFDESQVSRVTIPPVFQGIDIRNPIAAEDETNVVDIGLVDYAIVQKDEYENLATFLPDGSYNKTDWESRGLITEAKLDKIEDALYTINANMEASDLSIFNRIESINQNVNRQITEFTDEADAEIEAFERSVNTNVEQFKTDTNAAMTAHKNEVSEELESVNEQLEQNTKNIETREANILVEDDYDVEDISIVVNRLSTELYNKGGGIIFIPAGVYYIKSSIILQECVSMMGTANPYSYDGNTDKRGTMIIKDGDFTDFAIRLDSSSKLFNIGLTNISNIDGSGVQLYGNKCVVENVTISKFTNDGLQIGDMITKRNCNNWSLQNVNCLKNSGRGFVIDTVYAAAGPDTNAGLALKCSAWGNGSDGYYLGDSAVNTFLQCYSESNATVGWRITSKSKRNLLLGCGAEQNTEEQFLFEEGSSNNMYLGQTEFRPDSTGNNIFIRNTGGAMQKLQVSHPVYSGVNPSTLNISITGGFVSCGGVPGYVWYETDGLDGMKCFDIILNAGGFQYRLANDDGTNPSTYMRTTKNATSGILHSFNCNIGSSKMESATTLGSISKKLPIYNHDGSLAGYIPVYSNIE